MTPNKFTQKVSGFNPHLRMAPLLYHTKKCHNHFWHVRSVTARVNDTSVNKKRDPETHPRSYTYEGRVCGHKAVRLFSVSVSLFLFCLLVCFIHWFPHIGEIIWYLSFSDWLISLSITLSRSVYAVIKGKVSFCDSMRKGTQVRIIKIWTSETMQKESEVKHRVQHK